MKTVFLLALILLLQSSVALAQDFRALPPSEQPNAAELAYFSDKHPNAILAEQQAADAMPLVKAFLNDLVNGQFEAAHERIANDFRAYGPGLEDFLKADDLLAQWESNGRLFMDQQLTIETASSVTVAEGDRQGQWVFVKTVWSAKDSRRQGQPIRALFYELAQVRDNKIQRTYTSYGNDQLFYDLGFPIYSAKSELTQKR